MSNLQFRDFITKKIHFFLAVNKTPDVNPSILWETAKCYLRESTLSYTSAGGWGVGGGLLKNQLEFDEKVKHLEEFNPTPQNHLANF